VKSLKQFLHIGLENRPFLLADHHSSLEDRGRSSSFARLEESHCIQAFASQIFHGKPAIQTVGPVFRSPEKTSGTPFHDGLRRIKNFPTNAALFFVIFHHLNCVLTPHNDTCPLLPGLRRSLTRMPKLFGFRLPPLRSEFSGLLEGLRTKSPKHSSAAIGNLTENSGKPELDPTSSSLPPNQHYDAQD
jgi:hypothetical protein